MSETMINTVIEHRIESIILEILNTKVAQHSGKPCIIDSMLFRVEDGSVVSPDGIRVDGNTINLTMRHWKRREPIEFDERAYPICDTIGTFTVTTTVTYNKP